MRLERPPLRHDVRDVLLRQIMAGELRPGEPIDEVSIAGDIGVSRTPLREALMLLENEGVVEQLPRRGGFCVREVTAVEVAETYELLAVLESAALRGSPDPASHAQLARLRRLMDRMAKASTGRQVQSLDEEFHRQLTSGGSNGRLRDMVARLKDGIRRYEAITLADDEIFEDTVAQHRAIVDALERGDIPGAAEAVEFNWRAGAAKFVRRLERESPS